MKTLIDKTIDYKPKIKGMKIETKFELGQDIFGLFYRGYRWRIWFFRIVKIVVTDQGLQYNDYEEKDCFATKEEAQAECERRNNDNKNG